MTDNLILLARFYDNITAQMARGLLESNNIPCFLFDENHNSAAVILQICVGIRLMVPAAHYEDAHKILVEQQVKERELKGKITLLPKTKEGFFRSLSSIIVFVFTGIPVPFKGKRK